MYHNQDLNLLAVAIGALLPDADTKRSILGRLIPLWLIFKHRGFTHRLYGLFLFSTACLVLFDKNIAVSFFIGYLSHLILDAFTVKGLKWL
jgi:inner membrane protein